MSRRSIAFGAVLFCGIAAVQANAAPAGGELAIAQQGYVFAGGKYQTVNGKQVMAGQIYAEFQIPKTAHASPTRSCWCTARSRPERISPVRRTDAWAGRNISCATAMPSMSWISPAAPARATTRRVDGPQAFPDLLNTEQRFTAPERFSLWPQARLHTQWPGSGMAGDPVFDQFYASQVPFVQRADKAQSMTRDALVALLEKIGPAIVLTHSQSGSMGWLTADARPDLVRALVQVEPSGPPVHDVLTVGAPEYLRDGDAVRPWGLAAIRLNYAPTANSASDLNFVQQDKADGPGLARCWMQKAPARQLPNLAKMPMLIVSGEASFHAPFEHCTVRYLQQAGVKAEWIDLGKAGIHGNGHMMMLEKNNLDVAAAIDRWLSKSLAQKSATR